MSLAQQTSIDVSWNGAVSGINKDRECIQACIHSVTAIPCTEMWHPSENSGKMKGKDRKTKGEKTVL